MASCPCPGGGQSAPPPTRQPGLLCWRRPRPASALAWAPLSQPPSRPAPSLGLHPQPPACAGQAPWGRCRDRPSSSRSPATVGSGPCPIGLGCLLRPHGPLGFPAHAHPLCPRGLLSSPAHAREPSSLWTPGCPRPTPVPSVPMVPRRAARPSQQVPCPGRQPACLPTGPGR